MMIKSRRVWLGGVFLPAGIEMEKGKITRIVAYDAAETARDYGDARIVPGFIDVHTHGGYGVSANYATKEELAHWAQRQPREGITSFLMSPFTEEMDNMQAALAQIADVMETPPENAAEVLGAHAEGPFINREFKGAMNPQQIQAAGIEKLEVLQEAGRGCVKYITMAVEMDEDFALVRYAANHGVVVSNGHSGASFEQAMMGFANGASCFTHAFNAMSPLNHRAPGCVGALMRSDCYTEAIFDGRHITYDVLNILFKTKGKDRLVGVSDSLAAKGMPPGEYEVSGAGFIIDETGTALIKGTGTLAGSTLMFNVGLGRMVNEAGIPIDWALNAVSANPARLLGLDHRLGHIRAGYDADLVVLADDYGVEDTYLKGQRYEA